MEKSFQIRFCQYGEVAMAALNKSGNQLSQSSLKPPELTTLPLRRHFQAEIEEITVPHILYRCRGSVFDFSLTTVVVSISF
jgi:hypothetical protein